MFYRICPKKNVPKLEFLSSVLKVLSGVASVPSAVPSLNIRPMLLLALAALMISSNLRSKRASFCCAFVKSGDKSWLLRMISYLTSPNSFVANCAKLS